MIKIKNSTCNYTLIFNYIDKSNVSSTKSFRVEKYDSKQWIVSSICPLTTELKMVGEYDTLKNAIDFTCSNVKSLELKLADLSEVDQLMIAHIKKLGG